MACGEGLSVAVVIDGSEVTEHCQQGGWTPKLNGPAQATITVPMEEDVGDCGSRMMMVLDPDGDADIVFHGTILNTELNTERNGGTTKLNAQDPMELWQWRPVRDDGADFSKPDVIEMYDSAPQIIEAVLQNSVDSTGRTNLQGENGGNPPTAAEGDLFITLGTFEGGGVSVVGAPTDWPMTIDELFSLLVSTGQLDVVLTYIDGGTFDTMAVVDGYNGDYGTDHTGDVLLQYGMGLYNVASLRWNRDMTKMVNKNWLYGGPRVQTPADPAGDQHWCFNVTGNDSGLAYPPGGALSPPASATNNQLGVRIADSRDQYGVRMKVDIFDGYDEDCIPGFGTPGRELYRRQWQAFSWIAAQPRELIHVTPDADVAIGCFGIGDLITVEAVSQVRGGFSGAQRVHQYTVSWTATPSVLTLSEIQVSDSAEVG